MTRFCPECESKYEDDELEHCPDDGTRLRVIVEDADLDGDLIGRVLEGRWQIKERIGEGGMGTVFLATQQTVDRKVAIKMLKPALSSTTDYAERFMREANVATSLNNPHCVTVYDFGQTHDGLLYLAMELLEGRSLADVLRDEKLDLRDILTVGIQICSALAAAHAGNIVHRDLKPDNVFLVDVPGGGVFCKVLDFGIAKVIDNEDKTPVTQTGQIFGTPAYMSPEQCHSADVDQRSDLYSLGVILYELVSGRPPFHHGTPIKTLMAHINSEVEPPSSVGVPIPEALEDIILTLLEKEPDDRYADALAVREDLSELERELSDEELNRVPAQARASSDVATLALESEEQEGTVQGFGPATGESQDSDELLEGATREYPSDEIDATETSDREVPPETGANEVSDARGWSTGLVVAVAIGAAIATASVVLWANNKSDKGADRASSTALTPAAKAEDDAPMEPGEAQVQEPSVEMGSPDEDSIDREFQPGIASASDESTSEQAEPDKEPPTATDESGSSEEPSPAEEPSSSEEKSEPAAEDDDQEQTEEQSEPAVAETGDDESQEDGPADDTAESPELLGNVLTSESANRVITSHYPAIRRCYQKGLIEDADFGGAIEVKMVVSDAGNVVNSKIVRSEVDHQAVESCVASEIKGWTFPRPADGFYKTLNHTFSFGSD